MQEQRTIKYNKYVVAEDFLLVANYNSVMQLPFFLRAVINTSSKEYLTEKKQSINALAACFLLSGQKSTPTRAKKSIAAFKLREGALIGSRTTLRKKELHTVLEKLLVFVLPRLYSERQNTTILENTSLLFLNRGSKSYKPRYDQALTLSKIEFTQSTQTLSQQERSQLGIHLKFFKSSNNKCKTKNEKIQSKGPIYHFTLGIKDLLLIPEMQEFSPLFETVRGIDIDVALANPRVRVKKTFLPENLFFNKQKSTVQELPLQTFKAGAAKSPKHISEPTKQVNDVKDKKKLFDKDQFEHFTFTYNTVKHKEIERVTLSFNTSEFQSLTYKNKVMRLNDLSGKGPEVFKNQDKNNWQEESRNRSSQGKKSLLIKTKLTLAQKQDRERNHNFNTSRTLKDTTYLKQIRKIFFLTCFQFPSQYN